MDVMRSGTRKAASDSEPEATWARPFGRYGGGLLTGHPVGLVIVVGVILMALVGIPEARWFVAGSLILGVLCGLVLWLRHR